MCRLDQIRIPLIVLKLDHVTSAGDNPPLAKQLVRLFAVDALFAVEADPKAETDPRSSVFIDDFPYLEWPSFHKSLFTDFGHGRKEAEFIDLRHPIRVVRNLNREKDPPLFVVTSDWDASDPLADVFLTTLGDVETPEITPVDYRRLIRESLRSMSRKLEASVPVPADLLSSNTLTLSQLGRFGLTLRPSPFWRESGFFWGRAADFTDIVTYWNLRACGVRVVFYDASHKERLDALKTSLLSELLTTGDESFVSVWCNGDPNTTGS